MIGKVYFDNFNLVKGIDGKYQMILDVSDESKYNAVSITKEMKELKKPMQAVFDKKKRERSLNQNAMMWALLDILTTALNGYRPGGDVWETYIDILSKYGAKFEYFECTKEAFPKLKEMFRAIKIVDERIKENGTQTYMCKAYIGSSKYNTEEMTKLIDGIFEELSDHNVKDDKLVYQYRQKWIEEKAR